MKDDDFIKEKILKTFRSRDRNSIEDFLHNKAIDFEKKSLSATHIIYNEEGTEILGYFTFENKSLIIGKFWIIKDSDKERTKYIKCLNYCKSDFSVWSKTVINTCLVIILLKLKF